MKTLATLRAEVLSWLDETGSTGTTKTLVDSVLNQVNLNRSTQQRWPWMLSAPKRFNTVIGQTEYVLDERAYKLDYLYNTNTRDFVREMSSEQIVAREEGFGESTSPYAHSFEKAGVSPVKTFFSTPSTLTLTSTLAEANGHYLQLEGEDANGDIISENLAAGGTTTGVFARVTRVDKVGSSWAGTITLATSTGITLLVLTSTQPGKQYPVIRLLDVPAAVETLEYRWIRKPRLLVNDNDLPDVPFPDSQILVWDALILLAAYSEVDSEATNVWRQSQQACEQTLLTTMFQGDSAGSWGESVRDLSGTY